MGYSMRLGGTGEDLCHGAQHGVHRALQRVMVWGKPRRCGDKCRGYATGHSAGDPGHRGHAGWRCSHARAGVALGRAPQQHPAPPGCPHTMGLMLPAAPWAWGGQGRARGTTSPPVCRPPPAIPSLLLQCPGRAVVQLRRQQGGGGAGGGGEHPQRLHPLLPAPQRRARMVSQQLHQG